MLLLYTWVTRGSLFNALDMKPDALGPGPDGHD